MPAKRVNPATQEDPLITQLRKESEATSLKREEEERKRGYRRPYKRKPSNERANDSGEKTGDDLAVEALLVGDDTHTLPKNNPPEQENNMNSTPRKVNNGLDDIMDAIRNYADSMAREKPVNVSTFIAGINNSTVLNDIMIKAALRISWLKKRPQLDEASPKYNGGKNPA